MDCLIQTREELEIMLVYISENLATDILADTFWLYFI